MTRNLMHGHEKPTSEALREILQLDFPSVVRDISVRATMASTIIGISGNMILPPISGRRKPTSGERQEPGPPDFPSVVRDISVHNVSFYKDFWEYDPVTNGWIQKADFGGTARAGAGGLSISGKGYIGTGNDNIAPLTKDFWEYDPSTNSWAQKADFGGAVRWYPAGFSIGSKGYLGTGIDYPTHFNDFWEYTPEEDNSGGCIAPPAGLVS